MTIGILGGDVRQALLCDGLRAAGHRVTSWGVDGAGADTLEQALAADVVVLPLPSSRDGVTLHAPAADTALRLSDLAARFTPRQLILTAGLTLPGCRCVDYYAREELALLNAVPTAEAALAIAMEHSRRTLWEAPCLVVGYGRIGKVLCDRLAGMKSRVTAAARKPSDFAAIRAAGLRPISTGALADEIADFAFVFNTVPHPVLTRPVLARARPDAVLIDLASAPGGFDFAAADALGVRVIRALSLPAKHAPETAAALLCETVLSILAEEGDGPQTAR